MDESRMAVPRHVRLGKWAGLYGSVLSIVILQQVSATTVYARCPEHPLRLVLALSAVCALLSVVTGAWSWAVRQALSHEAAALPGTRNDRFIAGLSAAMAVVSFLYILFAAAAPLYLQCQR
jgi:hypothetical protein